MQIVICVLHHRSLEESYLSNATMDRDSFIWFKLIARDSLLISSVRGTQTLKKKIITQQLLSRNMGDQRK